jgi:isopenicillin-N epimerase
MASDRRSFLRLVSAAGAAGAVLSFPPVAISRVSAVARHLNGLAPEEVAKDEDFWVQVQQAFDLDSRYIALNNGANNGAARTTLAALIRYLELVNSAPLTYQRDLLSAHLETIRARLATMANCSPEELALTRNTTEAINIVIHGLPLKQGDEVICTDQDYGSLIAAWKQRAKREGLILKLVPLPTPPKKLSDITEVIERAITSKTRAIMISHIMDGTGQIISVRQIADLAHARGIQMIVDGALSFGTIEVDLKAIDCDYFATSLHKGLYAPMGTGFLYVKRERIASLWPLFGAAQPEGENIRKFESVGTRPYYQMAAAGAALDFHEAIGTGRIRARLHYLKRYWADRLASLPNVRFHTVLEPEQSCGIANVAIADVDASNLYRYLLEKHRIQAWPIKHKDSPGLWVSPFIHTTLTQLDRFVTVMTKIAREGLPA